MRLVILFDMFLITTVKWRQISPMYPELQLPQVNLYTRKDFKWSGIENKYKKKMLILNELKTSLMLKFSLQTFLQSLESLFLIW